MEHLNHDERRRKIARTAAMVIAREGIDAATLRRIAAEIGCSTTQITDSFEDKQDLLLSAYEIVSTSTLSRFEQQVAQNPANLIESLVSVSAIDEHAWCGWRVHVAFWEKAIRDPVLAAAQRSCIARARTHLERAFAAAYGPSNDIAEAARLIITLIHGISIQVMFEEQSWSRKAIHELLSRQLEQLLGRGPMASPQPGKKLAGHRRSALLMR